MQTNDNREIVLLELADEFLDLESYEQTLYLIAEDDLLSVECNLLIYIDDLFESGRIDFDTAKQAYEKLNIEPDRASKIRQQYYLEKSFFVENILN